ncbi:ATP-binding cassette domain-containing protein [Tetragenococcus halophilus]|uniref:ABC transporter ATP-binding protein n=2 Tax=Tetragenococcus halophilus TaxID=51669 RepID=A0AAN1SE50_TETHN|nr:ATP-binding cassette domain-containing protein [Tetragenococcus halophilus]AYW49389.1 ABC transporter ATP-binding protein [Tetragenococcus halophilus]MCO7025903.1 ATP-binding cassette domain-containing protein [Tetragenococcus halophilus]MCO8289233.1 ATP-binding cassette domain-containing protein [Tetragenococcus halophilus]MDN6127348.1 ATP-binding cassette domain-containing protein [Tetragenococcus halophilus]MDN6724421.1 ATP-binding cassette domain-containing protein [Tetragenococcus halo
MENLLSTHAVTKTYGKQNALHNVSIHVRSGEVYGLVGKNGAGKSTLFKVIMGLVVQDRGEVSIYDQPSIENLEGSQKNIGFMYGSQFFPYLNARENLTYTCKLKGITDKTEVDRVLKLVELDKVKKKVKTFSMGMKQRLNIANALVGKPDLIIMDEPINGLDPQGIASFRKLVQKLNREQEITFLLSSHILGELGIMATRFGFIHDGELLSEIDRKTLLEKTEDQVIIKVDNPEKAAYLLEEQLTPLDYVVNGDKEIILSDHIDETNKIAKILVDGGLELYKLTPHQQTLEEYYLSLIHQGGQENV